MRPSVSVVLPVRNGAQFLEEALSSVVSQTHRDFELIVVDDHSTDASPDMVRHVAEADSRVRLVASHGTGISAALNTGFEQARGDWVARMDADDVCLPTRLERQLHVAQQFPHVIGWSAWATTIDASGRRISAIRTGPETEKDLHRILESGGIIAILHSTVMVRRSVVLQAGGYDSRFDGAEDVELWDRIVDNGPILTLPEPLILCRAHAGSYSTERLAHGIQTHHYVAARRRARNRGDDLTYEEFISQRAGAPIPIRLMRDLALKGRLHYRSAGNHYAAGHLGSTASQLAIAALLNPAYTLGALWRQVLRRPGRRGAGDE